MPPSEGMVQGQEYGRVVREKEMDQMSSQTSSSAIVARCAGSSVPSRCAGNARGIFDNRHGRVIRSKCCMGLIL